MELLVSVLHLDELNEIAACIFPTTTVGDAFKTHCYANEIGPGVYGIHSPRVPGVSEMVDLLRHARAALG